MNHDRRANQSKSVARAVASLASKMMFDPDIVFEGAIRGACAQLLAAGTTPNDVAEMLEKSALYIRTVAQDNEPMLD